MHSTPSQPLQALLQMAPHEFLGEVIGRRIHLVRGNSQVAGLFSLDQADAVLSDPRLPLATIRITRNGQDAPRAAYTMTRTNLIGQQEHYPDGRRIYGLLSDGHTVVLGALHRFHPGLADLARALAAQVHQPVSINAYITPEATQGLQPHYDVQDVIVVQVAGQKTWQLGPSGLRRDTITRQAQEQLQDVPLQPHDVLYVPRGYLHSATGTEGLSLHLTIALSTVTRQDLIEAAVRELAADPWARDPWPSLHPADPAQWRAEAAEALKRLAQRLDHGELDHIPAAVLASALHDVAPEPIHILAQHLTRTQPTTALYRPTQNPRLQLTREDNVRCPPSSGLRIL